MEFFEQHSISVANSVVITGVTNTQADDEILDCLRSYGKIKQTLIVTDSNSSFYKNLIAEFTDASPLVMLKPLLPYTYPSQVASNLVFRVKLLADEFSATATVGSAPPTDYLRELQQIAQQSGNPFEEVLKGVMSQISQYLGTAGGRDDEEDETSAEILATATEPRQMSKPTSFPEQAGPSFTGQLGPQSPSNPTVNIGQRVSLSGHDLNPPEIQRVVVEHIVRKEDMSIQSLSPIRLRTFSGRLPKPTNEADYDSWRSHIELLRADPSLSPLHITRRMLDSLLPPAADLVKGLGPNAFPTALLRVLDSAYGAVQDGEELFAQFLNILQDHGERPSSYLQRLQLTLSKVVNLGGILAAETHKHLLKQFCRGCWDSAVINKLQLDQKKDDPPSFSELLFMLRTEEDRQMAKETLMKKHLPSSKQRATLQTLSTCSCGHSDSSAIEDLRKQMLKLQSQMSALLSKTSPTSAKVERQQNKQKPKVSQGPNQPKPWFCFKCGEDGHIAPACSNPPNPSLVEEKRRQLRQKQQAWEARNTKQSN